MRHTIKFGFELDDIFTLIVVSGRFSAAANSHLLGLET